MNNFLLNSIPCDAEDEIDQRVDGIIVFFLRRSPAIG
jgi:hypothetical protein